MPRRTSFRRTLAALPLLRSFSILAVLLLSGPATAAAQLPAAPEDPRLFDAFLAWDKGDYPAALAGYLDVLQGSDGERLAPEVARLTGDVWEVRELAPDGRGLAMSPDGRLVSFEVTVDDSTVTRVVQVADGALVATLEGRGAAFGPDGKLIYLKVHDTQELEVARAAVERARAQGNRQAILGAMRVAANAQAKATDVVMRTTPTGVDVTLDLGGVGERLVSAVWDRFSGDLWVAATGRAGNHLLRFHDGAVAETVPLGPVNARGIVIPAADGEVLLPLSPRGIARVRDGQIQGILEGGVEPAVSADGTKVAYIVTSPEGAAALEVTDLATNESHELTQTRDPLASPALSPDGSRVAFQQRVSDDWEIFVADASGEGEPRELTWEIQHDILPTWVDDHTVMAMKGESRDRRAFLYDVDGGEPQRLFHNNTVRTIAPEYEWVVSPDGAHVVLVSERDGDTVSPERGVYVVDLTRPVTRDEVTRRVQRMQAAENDLRERGRRAFEPIADRVRPVTEAVDVTRIYLAARDLFAMGSKYITQPGNAEAIDYYVKKLRQYGYEPELQWFEPRPGVRTANIVARLPGTRDPDLVYAVSSHFDSVERGPGSDDDTSGATALLETARVMKDHPQPATIEFAFFTGEEAGLLGSREYVRRAVEDGKHIVGALNNDMVGFANDYRLDNTIRYSNPGIRDIQHAAAIEFSDLITYDALYYKSTDAAAYYDAYGDIVGGIGSYPVLGSPYYHQTTDRLETVNQRLVAEVARTTVATIMLLASSPSRLQEASATIVGGDVEVGWEPAVESDVRSYRVQWTTPDGKEGERNVKPRRAASAWGSPCRSCRWAPRCACVR